MVTRIGFGAADITPLDGMSIPGSFSPVLATGTAEPLLAVASVIDDGTTVVAMVGIDTVAVNKETVAAARAAIHAQTGIPEAHVMVGSSHTHEGGPTVDVAGCTADPVYTRMVAEGITSAVVTAYGSRGEHEIGIGTGLQEGITFNRRFVLRNGKEATHPGKPGTPHHDEIVAPAGPVDESVGVLAARDASGRIVGAVVNFACHSTVVGGTQFSPDYAGALRRALAEHWGTDAPVVFLLGACGDLTQVDNMTPERQGGQAYAEHMGGLLAAETLRTVAGMDWQAGLAVACATGTARCAIRDEPDPEKEKPSLGLGSAWDERFASERALVAAERAVTPVLDCEVQGIRVGPLGIVSNGSEYFTEFGLTIKECSPFDATWVVTLANEYIGYVPTPQAFVAGGYEVRTARSSKLAPDAGQILLETSLAVLGELD